MGRLPVGFPTSAASTIVPSLDLVVSYIEVSSSGFRYPNFSLDFPLGFGPTYTAFPWENVYAFFCDGIHRPFCVDITVHNNGEVASQDVVRLYVEHPEVPVCVSQSERQRTFTWAHRLAVRLGVKARCCFSFA